MDRNTPIAVIVPFDAGPGSLSIRPAARETPPLSKVELPPPLETEVDIVELLLADRLAGL